MVLALELSQRQMWTSEDRCGPQCTRQARVRLVERGKQRLLNPGTASYVHYARHIANYGYPPTSAYLHEK